MASGDALSDVRVGTCGPASGDRVPGLPVSQSGGKGLLSRKLEDALASGVIVNRVWAGYAHLHAAGVPAWADGMMRVAREYRATAATPS